MGLSLNDDSRSPVVKDLRIVLLGKTGSGKSETGNTILGWNAFETDVSLSSVTKTSKKETAPVGERTVSVVDTPGIFDTSITEDELKNEIEKFVMLSVPGPHIFLLVLRPDVRFTEEEKNAIKWITDNLGDNANKYTMVLFTRGDMLKTKSIDNLLDESPEFRKVIADCRAGYIVFENTCKENRTQVADLFEKIDKIVQVNGNHYTSSVYEEAQKKLVRQKLWSKRADTMSTASKYLFAGAAVAAFAAAPTAGAAGAAARSVAQVTARSVLIAAGAVVTNVIGRWMKPQTN